jgi:hypothetical protein
MLHFTFLISLFVNLGYFNSSSSSMLRGDGGQALLLSVADALHMQLGFKPSDSRKYRKQISVNS